MVKSFIMSVKCEILSEDDFKAKNAYLRPFMAVTLVLESNHGYVSKYFPGCFPIFPSISQYFPVFPDISQYFPSGREIQVFPGKLPTLPFLGDMICHMPNVPTTKTRRSTPSANLSGSSGFCGAIRTGGLVPRYRRVTKATT